MGTRGAMIALCTILQAGSSAKDEGGAGDDGDGALDGRDAVAVDAAADGGGPFGTGIALSPPPPVTPPRASTGEKMRMRPAKASDVPTPSARHAARAP
jgi:hypothetical protein